MCYLFFFFFNDTATTEIYTLSLHDALPILDGWDHHTGINNGLVKNCRAVDRQFFTSPRSEEHTSELQSQSNLVCRLLLEKKKKKTNNLDIKRTVHSIPTVNPLTFAVLRARR